MSTEKLYGIDSLEKKFGPMTVGLFMKAFRQADDISQTAYAKKLKISRANLCDIEKGRKLVSPERAIKFAKIIKVPEVVLLKLSLQDILRSEKINYTIELIKVA